MKKNPVKGSITNPKVVSKFSALGPDEDAWINEICAIINDSDSNTVFSNVKGNDISFVHLTFSKVLWPAGGACIGINLCSPNSCPAAEYRTVASIMGIPLNPAAAAVSDHPAPVTSITYVSKDNKDNNQS